MLHQTGHIHCFVVRFFGTINCTQWKVTSLAPPLCCVVLGRSIYLQILYLYKKVFVMVLSQVLWLFLCLYLVSLFVCPFISMMRTICSVKLILFPNLCLKNVSFGFGYVPDNVWQIKSKTFLIFHY